MKPVFATLLLIALVQTQHVDEDKQTLILAGKIQDLQVAAIENVTIPDNDMKNGSKKKLKEFEDHAELKAVTDKPEESPTPITPAPKPVSKDNNTETDEGKPYTTTTKPASPPNPIPKQLNPVGVLDQVFDTKPSVPKKGADPKDEKLSVPKKGADPKEEKKSVPKKGADPKDEKQSVPKKGADPKNEKSSVAKNGADPNDEGKSVPRKGADPSILSESSSTAGYIGTDVPKLISPGKIGYTFNKNKTSPNMPTPSTKKKFIPTVNEASMDFAETSTNSNVPVTGPVVTLPKSDVSSNISKESEPVEPLTEDTTPTECYTTTNFKPTAATDITNMKGKGDEENISYTPAVVGVVLLVVIFITVIVVAYRRLQDVWMRRHYARMDFLIDGMYDV
ncbi:trans-Golgi network integral membrane protein 2-like isoform X2 [Palaemon carinicauda]|uniref:trans-Golgi network integral membrane protein 2-like isoform X2 n=1 Tax=Palaemon carinicauda TaxID=392227 RepID=UPI0035B68DA7